MSYATKKLIAMILMMEFLSHMSTSYFLPELLVTLFLCTWCASTGGDTLYQQHVMRHLRYMYSGLCHLTLAPFNMFNNSPHMKSSHHVTTLILSINIPPHLDHLQFKMHFSGWMVDLKMYGPLYFHYFTVMFVQNVRTTVLSLFYRDVCTKCKLYFTLEFSCPC